MVMAIPTLIENIVSRVTTMHMDTAHRHMHHDRRTSGVLEVMKSPLMIVLFVLFAIIIYYFTK